MSNLQKEELAQYARNCRVELCVGRCAYQFQPTVVSSPGPDPENPKEVVQKGFLFCQTCAHTVDIEFES